MKLNFLSIAILVLSLTVFVSCRDENPDPKAIPNQPQTDVETNPNPNTTAQINPAHGEPNHRCDIPVGAPLDQAYSTRTTTQPNTNNSTISPVRLQNSISTPAKNPPHGQPGHDCTVPVGADLK